MGRLQGTDSDPNLWSSSLCSCDLFGDLNESPKGPSVLSGGSHANLLHPVPCDHSALSSHFLLLLPSGKELAVSTPL